MLHRAVAQGPGEASQGDSRCKWGHIRGPEATSQMSLSAESGSDYDYEYEEGEEEEDEYDVASESAGEGDAGTADPLTRPMGLVRQSSSVAIVPADVIRAMMDREAAAVQELFCVTKDEAVNLLAAYDWNKSTLEERWFEDDRRVRDSACVHGPALAPSAREQGEVFSCLTCMDDVAKRDSAALACGHWFCRQCWAANMKTHVKDGASAVSMRCMMYDCEERLAPSLARSLLADDAEALARYDRFCVKAYVESSRDLRFCPAPNCANAVRGRDLGSSVEVQCLCGNLFCFACGQPAHRPASCEHVRLWNIKNSAESESVTWIMANTKPCPKCSTPIEKNQGCNHMTCNKASGGCGHEFCWLCLEAWRTHGSDTGGYFSCNKYENEKKKGSLKELEEKSRRARATLDRYTHYFERYTNHQRSMDIGQRTLEATRSKLDALQSTGLYKAAEVQFLLDAVHEVIECRRILQWTYVLGFYMQPGPEKQLFEFLQQNLEKNAEHLHGLVERPLDVAAAFASADAMEAFQRYRTDVTNFRSVTCKFRENLMTGVEGGLTEASAAGASAPSSSGAAPVS